MRGARGIGFEGGLRDIAGRNRIDEAAEEMVADVVARDQVFRHRYAAGKIQHHAPDSVAARRLAVRRINQRVHIRDTRLVDAHRQRAGGPKGTDECRVTRGILRERERDATRGRQDIRVRRAAGRPEIVVDTPVGKRAHVCVERRHGQRGKAIGQRRCRDGGCDHRHEREMCPEHGGFPFTL